MATPLTSFVNSFSRRIDPPARKHLKNVYGCLSLSTISAALGSYVHLIGLLEANLLTVLGTLGLLIALKVTPDDGKNQRTRLAYLLGFAFLSGMGLSPLLERVILIDPSIVVTALTGTAIVFVAFSISALLAERGQWLYLSGALLSVMLNFAFTLGITNLFLQQSFIYQIQLHLGLFIMCGFVIYDTQLILEKHHMGSKDFIMHSLDLFMDFIGIFRYLLEILARKENAKQRKR